MLTKELTKDADIRPISDLRNKFAEIANYVQDGNTVIFTRNGYGCMVTMSFTSYKHMTDPVVRELNAADHACEADPRHYTRDESLAILKSRMRSRMSSITPSEIVCDNYSTLSHFAPRSSQSMS